MPMRLVVGLVLAASSALVMACGGGSAPPAESTMTPLARLMVIGLASVTPGVPEPSLLNLIIAVLPAGAVVKIGTENPSRSP